MKTTITSDSKPETVGSKIVDQTADTRGSRINISIFLGLLILSVFVMPSIGFGSKNERWYGNIVFSILIGAGTAIAWRRRGLFLFSAVIGVLTLCIRWLALLVPSGSWELSGELASFIAVLMISWILLLQIFRSTGPTTVVSIQGAIAVYLLFGLAWANAYLIVVRLNPHSFQSTVGLSSSSATEWYYYSLCDADHIRLWGHYAAEQDCTCAGRRRSCHGTTLSRCFNCAIDWHGDHLLATKVR
jgi:hypothetical protein